MRTCVGILFHVLYMSFASGTVFIFTSVVSPLKPVVSHPEAHLPRMNIRFTEFSLPMAALEDDYNVGEAVEESIPQDIPAQELRSGVLQMEIKTPVLRLPAMKVPVHNLTELTQINTAPENLSEKIQRINPSSTTYGAALLHPHFWIEGRVELTGGLALASTTDEIRVGWFVDGQLKKAGKVSIREGRYSLKVEALTGEIIAELTDSKGFVVGEAIVDLDKILQERGMQQLTISNVDLQLQPYNFGFRARTLSVYDTPKSKDPVAEASVFIGQHDVGFVSDARGFVNNESVSAKSKAVLYASKKGYRDTVVISDFTKEQQLKLFPEKYMRALFESIDLPDEFRELGVVWGQVVNRGVPTGGYRVRLAQHPEVTTIYFDSYIPMERNKETSADGQYSIVGLEEGHYQIEVVDSTDTVVDTKLVYVKPGAISTIEFEVARRKTVYVKYFDPFNTESRSMEYVSLGQKAVTANTEKSVPISAYVGEDPMLLFAKLESSNTESATFASRATKYQELPVLDHVWFETIAQKYNIDKKKGVVVGFVDADTDFKVYLDKAVLDYKVIYFDAQGKIIKNTDVGTQKAGFIFYNTSLDLHTVLIETTSGQIVSEIAYVDGEAVAVLYKAL